MTSYNTTQFDDLRNSVVLWAEARGILDYGTPLGQATKTVEEANELLDAVRSEDLAGIIDGIGDTLVTLIVVARLCKVDVVGCLAAAYAEIKDRKGRMGADGIFYKE